MKFNQGVLLVMMLGLVLLLGFFTKDKTFDIQVNDTYFVIGYPNLFTFLGVLTGLFALICYLIQRFKRK